MIDLKKLISNETFNAMNFEKQKNYIKNTFGTSQIKVLAEIEKIDPSRIYVTNKAFIFQDGTFRLFGLFTKSFCYYNEKFRKFCDKNKLTVGDQFSYKIYLRERSKIFYIDNSFETYLKNNYKSKVQFQEQQLTEEYNRKEAELQNIIAGMENERAELNEDIEDLNNDIEDLNNQIETLNDEIEEKSNERYELEEYIESLNREKDSLEEKLKFLRIYGVKIFGEEVKDENHSAANINDFDDFMGYLFGNNSNEKITQNKPTSFDNFDEMINYWQYHLNTAKYNYLKYDKKILESLYFGLQTDQLILLMGNPGTGKTSLVKALAKSFDFADAAIIPVQSNWTDKSDLLGYYNPLEKSYVSTPFLDALINFSRQAENNPEKLFIICLDEMNLAHVEYYFAEFLSILQDENAEITLYSEQLRKDILYELQYSGFKMDGDKIFYEGTPLENLSLLERKYYFELRRLAQMLINYPAKFKIPQNVKFFGTLNQDETTLDISPKVLDRSYVIRVEKFFQEIPIGEEMPLKYKLLENYQPQHKMQNPDDVKNFALSLIRDLKFVHISRRVTEKIFGDKEFSNWQSVLSTPKIYDFIMASCVLSKVRLDEENYKTANEIKNLCTGELSKKILHQIDSGKDIDFWRR